MIGRWTVWVALLCAVIAGAVCAAIASADGWSFATVAWGLVCLAMLDAAWVFRGMSRRRRDRTGSDASDDSRSRRDGEAE
ncbi:hypothetical protein [Streptomonospora salina]|uniref:Uncharacterized protein n=1 Tax=Streptomonospora salina TaxID=104205 RepID=A0A841EAH0_9ACTN|nr:hypothetical protein [Streptomonospora salina]MBB5998319.1 hypothetical protein [Streptomonospora salina]